MQEHHNQPVDESAPDAAAAWTKVLAHIRHEGLGALLEPARRGLRPQKIDDQGRLVMRRLPATAADWLSGARETLNRVVRDSGAAAGVVLTDVGPALSVEPKPLPKAPRAGRGLQSVGNLVGAASGMPLGTSSEQMDIMLTSPAAAGELGYLHAYLAQAFLPRSKPKGPDGKPTREWTRRAGRLALALTAGRIVSPHSSRDIPLPLPYGSKPRLMLIDVCTRAIQNQSPVVDMEKSARQYLKRLGLQPPSGRAGGRQYTLFRNQAIALSACRMELLWHDSGVSVHYEGTPMEQFRAWADDGAQRAFWPGELRLDLKFYRHLVDHGLPLDRRAVRALMSSSLALDWYAFFAHRLRRIRPVAPLDLSWVVLRDAMGQEYSAAANFKKKSVAAIKKVMEVYPDLSHAVESVPGGLRLKHCPPPVTERRLLGNRQL